MGFVGCFHTVLHFLSSLGERATAFWYGKGIHVARHLRASCCRATRCCDIRATVIPGYYRIAFRMAAPTVATTATPSNISQTRRDLLLAPATPVPSVRYHRCFLLFPRKRGLRSITAHSMPGNLFVESKMAFAIGRYQAMSLAGSGLRKIVYDFGPERNICRYFQL